MQQITQGSQAGLPRLAAGSSVPRAQTGSRTAAQRPNSLPNAQVIATFARSNAFDLCKRLPSGQVLLLRTQPEGIFTLALKLKSEYVRVV